MSYALGFNALGCTVVALSAPLTGSMPPVPLAWAGAVGDPLHLYVNAPCLTSLVSVSVFTALLSLFVHVPLIYMCQHPIDFPRICQHS
jgi:hypothetical protein